MTSFQVLMNIYFLSFRIALLWFCLLSADCTEGSCSSTIVIFSKFLITFLVFNFPFSNLNNKFLFPEQVGASSFFDAVTTID